MNQNNYKSISHCKYLCQYHIIFCPKFRFSVLGENVEHYINEIFTKIAEKYEYEIISMKIMPDHIHLFIGAKPTLAPVDIVRTIKSISAIELFKQFPSLKKFYSKCGVLWSKGEFISTIEKISEKIIKKYIEEQKSC
jgi:putative transposase